MGEVGRGRERVERKEREKDGMEKENSRCLNMTNEHPTIGKHSLLKIGVTFG